jgi:hypothetical protein
VRFRACPHCGCLYNRRGNARCVECHRSLIWAWLRRPYRAPRPVPIATPEPERQPAVSMPPPSLRVPFGPRQGEPISPTGVRLGSHGWGWLSHASLIAAMVIAAVAVTAAVVMALTGHGGR